MHLSHNVNRVRFIAFMTLWKSTWMLLVLPGTESSLSRLPVEVQSRDLLQGCSQVIKKNLPDQIYNAANSFHLLRLQHNKSDKYASTKPFPSFTR